MSDDIQVGGRQETGRSRRAVIAIVLLFALVLVSAPVGLVLRSIVGEPYPWIFQPSFGYVLGADGTLEVDSPRITGVTEEGERIELAIADVMPVTRTNSVLLFRNNFHRQEVVDSPESAAMFTARLQQRFPGTRFTEVRIEWVAEQIDLTSGQRVPSGVVSEATIFLDPDSTGEGER